MTDNPQTTPQPPAAAAPSPAPAALSPEAQAFVNNLRAVDPRGEGIGLDKLRVFYPRVGWNVILAAANEAISAGLVKKQTVMNGRGGVAYHKYAVKG